jgi:hypothetical protein
VRLLRREALAARAEPVDVRAVPGGAAVTLAVSDPAAFLKHRLKRLKCSPIYPIGLAVGVKYPRCPA